jgi:hypothetical protein
MIGLNYGYLQGLELWTELTYTRHKRKYCFVDILWCRMFVFFPVLFSIIRFCCSLKTVLQMSFNIDKCQSGLAVSSDVLYSVMIFTCLSSFLPSAYIFNIINVCRWFSVSYILLLSNMCGILLIWLNRINFVCWFNKIQDIVYILYSNHVRYEKHKTFIMNPEKV